MRQGLRACLVHQVEKGTAGRGAQAFIEADVHVQQRVREVRVAVGLPKRPVFSGPARALAVDSLGPLERLARYNAEAEISRCNTLRRPCKAETGRRA